MVSREHKRTSGIQYDQKLELLRSLTNSLAVNDASIIVDASKYIEGLKEKVERLNQEITTNSTSQSSTSSKVTVQSTEKGYSVNVFTERSSPLLLVSVLEAFEEMKLDVVEARVSCTDSFQFEAICRENEEEGGGADAEAVRQTLLEAIKQRIENESN